MTAEPLERPEGSGHVFAVSAGRPQHAAKNLSGTATSPVVSKALRLRRKADFAPDFIVIGAMKAGTTTLRNYLAQFGEIGMSRTKETDYFIAEKNFPLGKGWYERQFDLSRPLLGEASPNYAKYDIFPGVPERIARVAPKAKLIFIARDPVMRFASHYRHSWSHGHMRVRPAALLAGANGRHMIECSRYGAQIDRYLAQFDREQLLFLDFDELCKAPRGLCDEVADFLGIDRRPIRSELPANTADQIAHVPQFLKRAARTTLARRFDRFIPKATRTWVRKAASFRKPETAPDLGTALLEEVADLLRDDAGHFRELSGKEFGQWRV
jgi:hypothetical protein